MLVIASIEEEPRSRRDPFRRNGAVRYRGGSVELTTDVVAAEFDMTGRVRSRHALVTARLPARCRLARPKRHYVAILSMIAALCTLCSPCAGPLVQDAIVKPLFFTRLCARSTLLVKEPQEASGFAGEIDLRVDQARRGVV